jgi:putative hydrolase of HD superfamily
MAMTLQRYANTQVKIDRVIKMLILHDLGEIETGDIHLYDAKRAENTNAEQIAVEKLFAPLPPDIRDEFMALWKEFAEANTAEARFARAIDRFQPFLSNLANEGGSWKTLAITMKQAFAKNQHIAEGSEILWTTYQRLAQEVNDIGYFHQESP